MALNIVVVFVAYTYNCKGSNNTKKNQVGKSQRKEQSEDLVVDGKKMLTVI